MRINRNIKKKCLEHVISVDENKSVCSVKCQTLYNVFYDIFYALSGVVSVENVPLVNNNTFRNKMLGLNSFVKSGKMSNFPLY